MVTSAPPGDGILECDDDDDYGEEREEENPYNNYYNKCEVKAIVLLVFTTSGN